MRGFLIMASLKGLWTWPRDRNGLILLKRLVDNDSIWIHVVGSDAIIILYFFPSYSCEAIVLEE